MPDATSSLIAGLEAELDHQVNGLISGRLTPAAWHNAVLQELADYHTAALLSSRRITQLDQAGRQLVIHTLADQAGYLNGLTDAIEAGEISDAQVRARAKQYAGALHATSERGKTWGAELPFYPADGGTRCLTHCRCHWQRRGGQWWWVLESQAEHCEDCRRRADGSPYDPGEAGAGG